VLCTTSDTGPRAALGAATLTRALGRRMNVEPHVIGEPGRERRSPARRPICRARADFNDPRSSKSGYLGGMCLAGACGLWETGFEGAVAPDQVVLAGVRDLGEREPLADTRALVEPLLAGSGSSRGAAR
jgi:hypothetical protein